MKTLGLGLLLLLAPQALGQPTSGGVVSPEVHPDRRVTFRVSAPKAADVTLTADWLAPGTIERLTKDERGVWSATVGPLEPGIAIYNFNIDGLAVADPVNPRVKLRARTSASLVEVPGDGTELWEPGGGPHGRVELVYVPSKALPGQTRESGCTRRRATTRTPLAGTRCCTCSTATTTPPPVGRTWAARITSSTT
jgi:hypothetical protein